MLAQGRFRLRFAPRSPGGLRERIAGDRAVVTVTGQGSERVDVQLIRQQGKWRIALRIPPMQGDAT